MKRGYAQAVVVIISLVSLGFLGFQSYLIAVSGGQLSYHITDWAFFVAAAITLWTLSRIRSPELVALCIALLFRSLGGVLFVSISLSPALGVSLDFLTRFGLFFLLSGVGIFGLLPFYAEESLLFRLEVFLFIIPLCALFFSMMESINLYREPMGIFPVYMHSAVELSLCIFTTLIVGALSMFKVVFSSSSGRYNILLPAYLGQCVLWGVFLFPLPLWLTCLLVPLFLVAVFFYSREIEEFYQP